MAMHHLTKRQRTIMTKRLRNASIEAEDAEGQLWRTHMNYGRAIYQAFERGWTIQEIADATSDDPRDIARMVLKWNDPRHPDFDRLSRNRSSARSDQSVYFIADIDRTKVKIGIAKDVKRRLRALQKMSSTGLSLLAVMPGGRPKEIELHERFAELRSHGEWFHLSDDLQSYIHEHSSEAAGG